MAKSRSFVRARLWRPLLTMLAVGVLAGACSKEPFQGEHVENQAPTVWLSSAPPEGTDSGYRVHLYWGGWDPDGQIKKFEYYITNNVTGVFSPSDTVGVKWSTVLGNDSTFTFSADSLVDSTTTSLVTRFERSHTFFLRAVDDQGMRSLEAAHRSFTAWTLSPTVRVKVPNQFGLTPAQIPPIATYRWEATDFINSMLEVDVPDSVRYVLHAVPDNDFDAGLRWLHENPTDPTWSDWLYYSAPNDSGKFWTTPPVDFGTYVFGVQAKDEAGAVTPVFDEKVNARRIRVSRRSTGPLLTVYNEFVGSIRTSTVNTPTVIVDLPAGVPVAFEWSADAASYGGTVSGYRYGWDLTDLNDDSQWDIDFTPFTATRATSIPKTFNFGVHVFYIEVTDNSGTRSRVSVKINYIQFTMERDLLLVDDYYENPAGSGLVATNGALPNDAEHDAFWQDMLSDVAGFRWDLDAIQVRGSETMSISKLASYKNIIWNAFGGYNISANSAPLLARMIGFRSKDPSLNQAGGGKVQPNLIALFIRAGGHVLLCGEQPLSQVINRDFFPGPTVFPLLYKYELEGNQNGQYGTQVETKQYVGDASFSYQDVCVSTLEVATSSYQTLRRRLDNGCGVELLRKVDARADGLRSAVSLDPDFPTLELRPEVAGPGKFYEPGRRGLNNELYDPPYFDFCVWAEHRSCFQPIYTHLAEDPDSPLTGAPIAGWSNVYADIDPEVPGGVPARSAFLGFEPFFFQPAAAKQMIDRIIFDEWQVPRAE